MSTLILVCLSGIIGSVAMTTPMIRKRSFTVRIYSDIVTLLTVSAICWLVMVAMTTQMDTTWMITSTIGLVIAQVALPLLLVGRHEFLPALYGSLMFPYTVAAFVGGLGLVATSLLV